MLEIIKSVDSHNIGYVFAGLSIGIALGFFTRNKFSRYFCHESRSALTTAMETHEAYMGGDPEYKMVLVIRNDLKMGKGKACAQCSHAAVLAYKQARKQNNLLKKWMDCGQRKVVVKVDSEMELLEVMKSAKQSGLISVLIQDAGRTQVESGTKTVVGIGPAAASQIDQITGHLKLY